MTDQVLHTRPDLPTLLALLDERTLAVNRYRVPWFEGIVKMPLLIAGRMDGLTEVTGSVPHTMLTATHEVEGTSPC